MASRKKQVDLEPVALDDRVTSPAVFDDEDARFDRLFRPESLDEFIGQDRHKQNLQVLDRKSVV